MRTSVGVEALRPAPWWCAAGQVLTNPTNTGSCLGKRARACFTIVAPSQALVGVFVFPRRQGTDCRPSGCTVHSVASRSWQDDSSKKEEEKKEARVSATSRESVCWYVCAAHDAPSPAERGKEWAVTNTRQHADMLTTYSTCPWKKTLQKKKRSRKRSNEGPPLRRQTSYPSRGSRSRPRCPARAPSPTRRSGAGCWVLGAGWGRPVFGACSAVDALGSVR